MHSATKILAFQEWKLGFIKMFNDQPLLISVTRSLLSYCTVLGQAWLGPCMLWLKTIWPVIFWLLTFGAEWRIGFVTIWLGTKETFDVMDHEFLDWCILARDKLDQRMIWLKTFWTQRQFEPFRDYVSVSDYTFQLLIWVKFEENLQCAQRLGLNWSRRHRGSTTSLQAFHS